MAKAAGPKVEKYAVKYKTQTHVSSIAGMKAFTHWHYCSDRDCRSVYADMCETPDKNQVCSRCRTGKPDIYQAVSKRDPIECCFGNCQLVDLNRRLTFGLAGPGPWYQCSTCLRSHGWPCT